MKKVVAGDYFGKGVSSGKDFRGLCIILKFSFFPSKAQYIEINKDTVEKWEEYEKTPDYRRISIEFKDGKRSLIQIDNELYRYFLHEMF